MGLELGLEHPGQDDEQQRQQHAGRRERHDLPRGQEGLVGAGPCLLCREREQSSCEAARLGWAPGAHVPMAGWAPSPARVHVGIGGPPHVLCERMLPHVPHPGGRCAAITPAWGRGPWLCLENTGVGRQETVVHWCPGLHHGVPTLRL